LRTLFADFRTPFSAFFAGALAAFLVVLLVAVDVFAAVLLAGALLAGAFLAVVFLAAPVFLAVLFFAADVFFAAVFVAVEAFFAVDFLAAVFFAGAFLAVDFLAGDFFAAVFLAGDFFAADFFAAATCCLLGHEADGCRTPTVVDAPQVVRPYDLGNIEASRKRNPQTRVACRNCFVITTRIVTLGRVTRFPLCA